MLAYLYTMSRFIIFLVSVLVLCAAVLPHAEGRRDESQSRAPRGGRHSGSLSHVARALQEAGYLSELQARPRAKHYIFFCSASWCGICQQMLPQVLQEYETNIRKNRNVELVLLNYDYTEQAAREYMAHHAAVLPGVQGNALKLESKPTFKYIPACFIVTDKGELVAQGGGNLALEWKNEIQKTGGKGKTRLQKKRARRSKR